MLMMVKKLMPGELDNPFLIWQRVYYDNLNRKD